jgi:hypothetical protein
MLGSAGAREMETFSGSNSEIDPAFCENAVTAACILQQPQAQWRHANGSGATKVCLTGAIAGASLDGTYDDGSRRSYSCLTTE